jgi:putative ABC transport system substrate-binding protein
MGRLKEDKMKTSRKTKTLSRRVLTALLIFAISGGLAFAGGGAEQQESNAIGISKFVSHPALDAAEQGIMDELNEAGYDFEFDLENAQADANTAAQIANKFRTENVRLAVGIATPTSQALVQNISDIPIVYTLVTDPVAAGLVESYDQGGENVTGFSDRTPVREQIELLVNVSDIQTLGHIYTSSEANAVVLADTAREVSEELGIDFVESTVTNSAEVRQATQAIVGRVDAIYISTDNTVVSALSSVTEVAVAAGVPVVSADPTSAEQFDVLAAYGFDYYTMGRATGRLISEIVEGADPSEVPTQYMTDPEDLLLFVNLDVAQELGLRVSEDLLSRADIVIEDGEKR